MRDLMLRWRVMQFLAECCNCRNAPITDSELEVVLPHVDKVRTYI